MNNKVAALRGLANPYGSLLNNILTTDDPVNGRL